MAISVMNWVWDHSQSRHGARLVLLAIADSASSDGDNAWPSVAELRRKTGLGERAVQVAITELVTLGELGVDYNAGPKGCNRYRVVMRPVIHTPAESAPPQIMHPAESAPPQNLRGSTSSQAEGHTPAESAPPANNAPPQISTGTPAESAPVTILNPSLIDHLESVASNLALPPDDDLILKAVIDPIHKRTGRVITADRARLVAASILNGRHPKDPAAYVRRAIQNEQNPAARFLADIPEPPARPPPWCRKCDERTRMRELDDGRASRCPDCHPLNARPA